MPIPFKRPSRSLAIAALALFVAMGGTGYAASQSATAAKKKRRRSPLATQSYVKSETKKLIKQAAPGLSVKSAKTAGSAFAALIASQATNATNATHAATADSMNGLMRFRVTIGPSGFSFANGNAVTLAQDGPLSLVGKCYSSGGVVHAATFLGSTVAAHWQAYDNSSTTNGSATNVLSPGTEKMASETEANSSGASKADFQNPFDGTWAAITDNGSAYMTGLSSDATDLNGSDNCTFAGYALAT